MGSPWNSVVYDTRFILFYKIRGVFPKFVQIKQAVQILVYFIVIDTTRIQFTQYQSPSHLNLIQCHDHDQTFQYNHHQWRHTFPIVW